MTLFSRDPLRPDELISKRTASWKESEGKPESTLLRLALLREIMRELHGEKSVMQARGILNTHSIQSLESRLEELKKLDSLQGALPDLVLASRPMGLLAQRKVRLPEDLLHAIGPENLDRYDRGWEKSITEEAFRLGWEFISLSLWVQVAQAERFHHALWTQFSILPIVLFAESLENSPTLPHLWHGRWILVSDPKAELMKYGPTLLENMTEVSNSPSPPEWKLLNSGL